MSHEITYRDCQIGLERAWHKLTKVVPEITAENEVVKAGVLYTMEKQRLQLPSGIQSNYFHIVSIDDGLPIGPPVTDRYQIISNRRIWKAVDEAFDGTEHKIVSIGTVMGRERGFISIKLNEENTFEAAGRRVDNVVNIMWGHGGGGIPVTAKSGFTVIVCNNTFNMAMSEKGEFKFKIRHKGDAELKLIGMKEAIESHIFNTSVFRQKLNEWHNRAVNQREAKQFYAGFIVDKLPDETKLNEEGNTISTRAQNQFNALFYRFLRGRGNNGETAADLFNGATEYFTHGINRNNAQKRFESSEFGSGQERKDEVFRLLCGENVKRVGDYEACVKRGEKVLNIV